MRGGQNSESKSQPNYKLKGGEVPAFHNALDLSSHDSLGITGNIGLDGKPVKIKGKEMAIRLHIQAANSNGKAINIDRAFLD